MINTQYLFDRANKGEAGMPLVFGEHGLAVQRLDHPEHNWLLKHEERARSLYWSPTEFTLTSDGQDFNTFDTPLKELFLSNFKMQSLADSLVGRTISQVFLPVVSHPALDYWFHTHMYFENNIHSPSYLEILKAILPTTTEVFDDIMINPTIQKRIDEVLVHYEHMYQMNIKRVSGDPTYVKEEHHLAYLKALFALNILEGTIFSTSFLVSFAFAEQGVMMGSAKYLSKIAVDENMHLAATMYLLKDARKTAMFKPLFKEHYQDFIDMYKSAYDAELAWIDYLFELNPVILGLTKNILIEFLKFNLNRRMSGAGLNSLFAPRANPVKWMTKYTSPSNVQQALQEVQGTEYEINKIDFNLSPQQYTDATKKFKKVNTP